MLADYSAIHLAICVPMANTSVDVAFHLSFYKTMELLRRLGIANTVHEVIGGSHIGKARERALWNAMKAKPQATHFLWIDNDMGWAPPYVLRLLNSGHDFAACAGVRKKDKVQFCFNPMPDPAEFHPVSGFIKIRHVGFAFVMHTRAVIDRLCEANEELRYDASGDPEYALFMDALWDYGGELPQRLSEDFTFCQRWLDVGGEIWLDPDASLIHAGRKEFSGAPRQAYTPHPGIGNPELDGLILAG